MLTRDDIVQKLGITSLDAAGQDEILQQLADSVRTRLMLKIAQQLSDEDMDVIGELIDAGKDEEVEEAIRSKVDNYDEWAEQIELDTINELENNQQAIKAEVIAQTQTHAPTD